MGRTHGELDVCEAFSELGVLVPDDPDSYDPRPGLLHPFHNLFIAVIVVSAAAAVFLEAATILDRYFGRHGSRRAQSAYNLRLAPKLLGILRVVLSYFALPLSAISFYQLSTAQQLPIYHTAFATILILSCMLAFLKRVGRNEDGIKTSVRLFHFPSWTCLCFFTCSFFLHVLF